MRSCIDRNSYANIPLVMYTLNLMNMLSLKHLARSCDTLEFSM
jgi:hypothetical protein